MPGYRLIFAALLFAFPIAAETTGFPVPGIPYGLTHDGQDFWFTELSGRKLYRADTKGRLQGHFYGNRYIYGIRFSPFDGYIYAGSRNAIFRYSPITGKQVDRLSVKVDRVAGIAFGPGVIYLLEKGNGKVHVYNPETGRIAYSGETHMPEARDIAFYRGQLWITDGASGSIQRFDPGTFQLTGSLEAPCAQLRGLAFVRGELWILNRDTLRLESLFFSEGPYFIAGQEKNRSLLYRIHWQQSNRALAVVLPSSSRSQRVGNPMLSSGKNWEVTYLADSTRVLILRPDGTQKSGILEFRIPVALRSVNYLFRNDSLPTKVDRDGCDVNAQTGPIDWKKNLKCHDLYRIDSDPLIPGPPGQTSQGSTTMFKDSVNDFELIRLPQGVSPSLLFSVAGFRAGLTLDDLSPESAKVEIFMEAE